MTWQFTVCTIDANGSPVEVKNKLTPVVNAEDFYKAIEHPEIVQFCADNQCRIYKIAGR